MFNRTWLHTSMEKEYIIEQCLICVNQILGAVNAGTSFELISLSRWTEALARHVLYSKRQHPVQKHLMDAIPKLIQCTVAVDERMRIIENNKEPVLRLLEDYIKDVQSSTRGLDVDDKLQFAPPVRDDGGRLGWR